MKMYNAGLPIDRTVLCVCACVVFYTQLSYTDSGANLLYWGCGCWVTCAKSFYTPDVGVILSLTTTLLYSTV